MNKQTIVVFGSLNMDLVVRSPRLPQPGETLLGESFQTVPGGKGGNQAVAAARLGAVVAFVGRVGADQFGQDLIASLHQAQVETTGITVDPAATTGIAAIAVDHRGENTILVVPGANAQVGSLELQALPALLAGAHSLLLQLEIPLPIVVQAAQLAQAAGVLVIFDPAPAHSDMPDELLRHVDILTPNQVETAQLTGIEVMDRRSAMTAAQALHQRSGTTVLVKLGADGVILCTPDDTTHIPAYVVEVVDTVAAGDAFNGGLAVALSQGRSLVTAVQYATAVAAISVTRSGAQSSLPTADEVAALQQAMPK